MTNNNGFSTDIKVNGQSPKAVLRFKFLGVIMTDRDSKPKILSRISQKTSAPVLVYRSAQIKMQTYAITYYMNACLSMQNMDLHC